MFFARCVVFCLSFLKNKRKPIYRHLLLIFDYYGCKRKVIAWHKTKLEKLDPLYRMEQAGLRLMMAREEAHAAGIGPSDPRYPGINDFVSIDWDKKYPQERVDAVTEACVSALKSE